MIQLHRLNKTSLFLNHRHIETMEANPDTTVITLTNDRKYVVREKVGEIIDRITRFEADINQRPLRRPPITPLLPDPVPDKK